MWHTGQEYPIPVAFDDPAADPAYATTLERKFRARYRELYGRSDDELGIELATVRAVGTRPEQSVRAVRASTAALPPMADRQLYEPRTRRFVKARVLPRSQLPAGQRVAGPLVVQDRESGIAIREGDSLELREHGAIFVQLRTEDGAQQ
jgi:N-methylhydantoinase A